MKISYKILLRKAVDVDHFSSVFFLWFFFADFFVLVSHHTDRLWYVERTQSQTQLIHWFPTSFACAETNTHSSRHLMLTIYELNMEMRVFVYQSVPSIIAIIYANSSPHSCEKGTFVHFKSLGLRYSCLFQTHIILPRNNFSIIWYQIKVMDDKVVKRHMHTIQQHKQTHSLTRTRGHSTHTRACDRCNSKR